jgi:hypothetical protein
LLKKEAMAPCIYVGLAIGAAPGGHIRFGSLEFTDVDGPPPVDSLLPDQVLHFEDLDFVADHMGQLRLSEGDAAPPHIPMLDLGPTRAGPMITDSDALACRIDDYLRANPELELSRRVFYVLANAFAQLSGSGPMPQEIEFWNPSIVLPLECVMRSHSSSES